MRSEEAQKDFPDEKQRLAVAYSKFRERKNDFAFTPRNSASSWPTTFKCKFIVPGLVHYDDYGTVLVRKEILDSMAQTFVGKPVINVVHKDVAPDIYENAEADGIVTRVWYDPADGWFWCEFIVWDEATQFNCRSNAYSVSCAYDVSSFKSEKGTFNNVPYEQEVLSGSYTHLAIVANPRYEDARIVVLNSKGGSDMKLKFWEKNKTELKNVGSDTMITVDGKPVKMQALIEAHNAKQSPSVVDISDEATVEIDGKEFKVSELKNSYRDSIKNADEDEDEKKKKAENEKAEEEKKKEDERKNAEDEEAKKKKDAEDLKNAEEEKEKKKKEEMENSIRLAGGTKHFNDLKTAAELRGSPQEIKVTSQRERIQVGRQKYGSAA